MEKNSIGGASSLHKRLKHLRISKEWSQGEVAAKLEIDMQRVSKFERGVTKPPVELLPKMAKLFEVSLDYLITGNSYIEEETVKNPNLIKRFQKVDTLPKEKQIHLIALMDAFIKQQKLSRVTRTTTMKISLTLSPRRGNLSPLLLGGVGGGLFTRGETYGIQRNT